MTEPARSPDVGQPFHSLASRDYVRTHAGDWHVVEPTSPAIRTPPRALGARRVDLGSLNPDAYPELGIVDLEDAWVLAPHGWIVPSPGVVLGGHSFHGQDGNGRMKAPGANLRVVDLPGVTVSLMSDFAHKSYGHMLLDAMPRLDLYERAGFDIGQADTFLCQSAGPGRRLWSQLGVPEARCIWVDQRHWFRCERLIAPSFPGSRHNAPPWAVAFLRARLTQPAAGSGRRLYLPRTTSRFLSNEAALLPLLLDHGFEVFDPGAGREDPRAVFAAAEIVVGASGGAFSDLTFCAPGTRVLELIPSDHVRPYWYALSSSAGLDYAYVVGASSTVRGDGSWGPSPYDFTVDVAELASALRSLLPAKSGA